jgi:hypothetical protein
MYPEISPERSWTERCWNWTLLGPIQFPTLGCPPCVVAPDPTGQAWGAHAFYCTQAGRNLKKKYSFPAFNVFIVFTSQKAKSQKSRITKSHNKPTKQDHPDRLVCFDPNTHLQITHARWPGRGRPLLTWAASIVPCFRDFSDHGGFSSPSA